jgi:hypothetical protein
MIVKAMISSLGLEMRGDKDNKRINQLIETEYLRDQVELKEQPEEIRCLMMRKKRRLQARDQREKQLLIVKMAQ